MIKTYFKVPDAEDRKLALGILAGCPSRYKRIFTKLAQEHLPIKQTNPGDWLEEVDEDGQSYDAFLTCFRAKPDKDKTKISLQPLDSLTEQELLSTLKAYATAFFPGMEICIATKAKNICEMGVESRKNEIGELQYFSREIITNLAKGVNKKIFCRMGMTIIDLYPHPETAWCYGQASKTKRAGVFSFARYLIENPDYSKQFILYSVCKVMLHEICHMFGLKHCVFYQCLMNGAISPQEENQKPTYLCPICLRKLHSVLNFDIINRYKNIYLVISQLEELFGEDIEWLGKVIDKLETK